MLDLKNPVDEENSGYLVTAEKKAMFSVELDLLREFDALCDRAGLQYWVCFGALLGAVRHKGFIPWDDDIDVVVPRPDFDRLYTLDAASFGVKEPYFLQTNKTDKGMHQVVIRFRRSDTTFMTKYERASLEKYGCDVPYNLGIGLSVLPLDGVPDSKFVRRISPTLSYGLMGTAFWGNQPPQVRPATRWFFNLICRVVGSVRLIDIYHSFYRASRYGETGDVQVYDGVYNEPTRWPAELFAETVTLPFEDTFIKAPAGYDELLRMCYGDYMQFPSAQSIQSSGHNELADAEVPYTVWKERLLESWRAGKKHG